MGDGTALPAVILRRWNQLNFVIDGWHRLRVAAEWRLSARHRTSRPVCKELLNRIPP